MEFFTWPWMNLFFKEEESKYKYTHLGAAIKFIPYGVTVDEFQHFVYENPEATPAERKTAWRDQLFPQRRISLEDGVALFFHRLDLLPDGVLVLGCNFSNRLHWCGCGGKGGGRRADGRYHQRQCQCKAPNRFLFHGMLRSFLKYFWLSFNLVCSIAEAALKFPRESAGKVSQIRHSACVIQ